MNEFEWRRQLRALRQPLAPSRDLWPALDAALDRTAPHRIPAEAALARQPQHRRRWLMVASFAAAVLLAGGIGWRALYTPSARLVADSPMTRWQPADPRLSGAAIELDAARKELQQAMQQLPQSAALQRLMVRTEQQQTQLRRLADAAS